MAAQEQFDYIIRAYGVIGNYIYLESELVDGRFGVPNAPEGVHRLAQPGVNDGTLDFSQRGGNSGLVGTVEAHGLFYVGLGMGPTGAQQEQDTQQLQHSATLLVLVLVVTNDNAQTSTRATDWSRSAALLGYIGSSQLGRIE